MTKINKLILHGFKSFAKRTELVFGNNFNCVLGPNGSGKSNILDALCFVLGKSSAKSMRAEKSSNLIYNGGKSKKPAAHAEVSIFFDNASKVFPTEDKEVKITRIVKPKGQSVYRINDQNRTRTQILELLSLAKIDPDGYNIILQGDIIRLIDMSPVERRQIVEEISGISIYEDKKQKALSELEKVDGKLKEAEIILSERQSYLKDLKKERDQAQKYKDLDSKISTNKATHLHRQIEKKSAEKEEFDERISKHKGTLDKVNAQITELRDSNGKDKVEIDAINKEIEEKGEKEQLALHKEVEKLKVDLATSKNRMETCRDEIAKIKTRKDNLNENLNEVGTKINELASQKKAFEETKKQKESEQKEVLEKIAAFRKKHKLDNVADMEKEIDSLDKKAEDIQKEIQEMRQKQQELLREKDKYEFQIQSIDEKIEKVLSVEKEHKEQIAVLKQKKTEFKKATLELNQLQTKNTTMAAELGESRRKLVEAQEEMSRLNARNAQIQEKLGSNIALKRILEMRKNKRGIYGTVSELGEVSKKYSLALEVAAGAKLKSVVVESDAVAADCINYLKKNRFGIATFLPLNKIRNKPSAPGSDAMSKKPGVFGKAVDLITFDPKFKKIFSYVFEDTLVVKDVATARKLGIGTAKMVTLDGDIVERSGAMQGGFRQKREGLGFGEKEVSNALKNAEKVCADLGLRISKLEKSKNNDEDQISRLRELKANLEGDIIKMEKSLHLDDGDMDVNKKIKQEIGEKIKKLDTEIDEVINKLSQMNRELADFKVKKAQFRGQVSELRNPRLLAELNAFEEAKSQLREELIKIAAELKNLDAQTTTMLEPERENISRILKQHDKEIELFDAEIGELKTLISTKETDLHEKEKKEKEFYAQFKDLFAKRQKLSDQVNKREAKVYSLNEDVRKAEHKINSINIEVAKIDAVLGGLQKEFEQFEGVELDHEKPDAELMREINSFERMVQNLGTVNMKALEIYDTAEKEYNELQEKKAKLHTEKEDVIKLMEEIEGKKKVLFMKTFESIQENFQRLFSSLSTKGEASLILENPESPFDEGLLIKVRITGKKFLDIRSLSGGEKTMTALAFIFAVQECEPASFYVLDEVDAALDKKNSEKLSELIKKYSDRAQYILISHNDGVITEANYLYGVSMNQHGMSDVVTLKV